MITTFHHEQETKYDKEVIKVAEAFQKARSKSKIAMYADELAVARSAADEAAIKCKNVYIRHGGDYTSIHLLNPSKDFSTNARVAILTCKPGPYPKAKK